jgi:hypothetical protein
MDQDAGDSLTPSQPEATPLQPESRVTRCCSKENVIKWIRYLHYGMNVVFIVSIGIWTASYPSLIEFLSSTTAPLLGTGWLHRDRDPHPDTRRPVAGMGR